LLYKNLSGRLEEAQGVTLARVFGSLASIPWLKSVPFMARGAFCMGNSSFTDFSVGAMNALLLLLGVANVLYCRTAPRGSRRLGEAFLWAPVLLFAAAMIYVTGSSYSSTKGLAIVASPWYVQAVMPPFLCVALLGCQRSERLGKWTAAATVLLSGYILACTYTVKLIPLYGGFSQGRSTLRDIVHW